MTSSTAGEIGVRHQGWSPELLTVLGAVLAIGVGLAGLMLNFQGQIREEIRSLETRLREDMGAMEIRLREDMGAMETRLLEDMDRREARIREDMRGGEARIRDDVRELRNDVGEIRERVSHLEGRFDRNDIPERRPGGIRGETSPS